jgi:hypothetical protein
MPNKPTSKLRHLSMEKLAPFASTAAPWKEARPRVAEPHDEETALLDAPAPAALPPASPLADSPLASRLKSAGASSEEIAALLEAIAPPK